jgi:hypothetical protein
MKKISLLIAIAIFSCNSYNSKMNNLLSLKKQTEDSIETNIKKSYEFKAILDKAISDRTESIYLGKSFNEKVEIAKVEDEKIWQKVYSINLRIKHFQEKLPQIVYSIDSLIKLK